VRAGSQGPAGARGWYGRALTKGLPEHPEVVVRAKGVVGEKTPANLKKPLDLIINIIGIFLISIIALLVLYVIALIVSKDTRI
jgi:hypothetical protein